MEIEKISLVVWPGWSTYLVSDVNVVAVLRFLFDPEQRVPIQYVVQDASGCCLIEEEDKNAMPFSTLPLHSDTVADNPVYDLFAAVDFDREATLREFKAWGIDKVYLAPFYDKVISMEDFIDGVQKHFVGKGKDYYTASSDEKMVIFH